MSDKALIRRLTPLCTCDGETCADDFCAGCTQLDPEWDCLRVESGEADVSEMADKFCTCGAIDPKTFGHRHDCAAVDEKKQLRARVQNAEAAANRLLQEKDQWHDSARVAEAELARQRPVVDAAEALVGEYERHGSVVGMSSWEPIHRLVATVKEAQR